MVNPLKPELNPICYLLALLGAHHFSSLQCSASTNNATSSVLRSNNQRLAKLLGKALITSSLKMKR